MSRIIKLGTLPVVVAVVLISIPALVAQEAKIGEAAPVRFQGCHGCRSTLQPVLRGHEKLGAL